MSYATEKTDVFQCIFCNKSGRKYLMNFHIRQRRKRLGFSFLVLGAKILVTTLAAAGRADCITGIAMHTYFHIE